MRIVKIAGLLLISCLSGCEGWSVQLGEPNGVATMPSRTPLIDTATPFILKPSDTPPTTASLPTPESGPNDIDPGVSANRHPHVSAEHTNAGRSRAQLAAEILGCETGLDLSHGMGEVTNAYVVLTNTGNSDAHRLCATLTGLDEGRPHPDKTECLAGLPAGYEVTLKLTIDTTYEERTAIQVEITSNNSLLLRLGEPACTSPVLIPGQISNLRTPEPIP